MAFRTAVVIASFLIGLGAVARDGLEAHGAEQRVQLLGLGMRILDELESVGAHRVLVGDFRARRRMGEGAHEFLLY